MVLLFINMRVELQLNIQSEKRTRAPFRMNTRIFVFHVTSSCPICPEGPDATAKSNVLQLRTSNSHCQKILDLIDMIIFFPDRIAYALEKIRHVQCCIWGFSKETDLIELKSIKRVVIKLVYMIQLRQSNNVFLHIIEIENL